MERDDRGGDLGFRRGAHEFAVEAFARFETERGLPIDIIRRTNAANHFENAWAKFERAEIDLDTFDELFAEESRALGAEVRGRDVLPLLSGSLRPEMVNALKIVKQNYKTGCITNNLPANAIGSASDGRCTSPR